MESPINICAFDFNQSFNFKFLSILTNIFKNTDESISHWFMHYEQMFNVAGGIIRLLTSFEDYVIALDFDRGFV